MIKIAITDDEKVEVLLLEQYVREWAKLNNILVDIHLFYSGEAFEFEWQEDKSFDILLLDIQMQELDGINLAKRIRENDEELKIIFITAISSFIQEGYEVDALNYLLKPVKKERLFQCLDKAIKRIEICQNSIIIETEDETKKILHADIIYIEAVSHFLNIHTLREEIVTRMSLNDLEKLLPEDEFIRCHRSFIAGIRHINSILRDTMKMDNSSEISVSRRQYKFVNQAFIKYFQK